MMMPPDMRQDPAAIARAAAHCDAVLTKLTARYERMLEERRYKDADETWDMIVSFFSKPLWERPYPQGLFEGL